MKYKLTKTFLSDRPGQSSFILALFSLSLLLIFFSLDQTILIANRELVFQKGEYWRAWTSALLHGDLNHLAHNAFFFSGLAMLLHHYFGLWIFPILSVVMGGLINMAVLFFYPSEVTLVGVSGIVYFMASFWLTLYLFIEKRQSRFVRFIHAIAVSLIFLFPETFDPQTSYLAHGIGFLFGVPTGIIYYSLNYKKIRAKDVWTPVEKEKTEWEDIILLDESSYHPLPPEDEGPSRPSSDCARCQSH